MISTAAPQAARPGRRAKGPHLEIRLKSDAAVAATGAPLVGEKGDDALMTEALEDEELWED